MNNANGENGTNSLEPEAFAGMKNTGSSPRVIQGSALFSITVFAFLFIGYRVQIFFRDWEVVGDTGFYIGAALTEFGLILLPALAFLILYRFPIRRVIRFNGTKPLNFVVIFGMMIFAIPIAAVFNLLNLLLVNTIFGRVIVQPMPTVNSGLELLISVAVVAGSAGICEEFLFRGVLQRSFERFGTVRAILLASFLFSIMHMDFQKVFGTFFLGALIGFIVYRTNSLFCGMFAHFTNNAIAVLVGYASTKFSQLIQSTGAASNPSDALNELFSTFSKLPPQQIMIVLVFYGFLLLFGITLFALLLFAFLRVNRVRSVAESTLREVSPQLKDRDGKNLKGLLWLLPGVMLVFTFFYVEVFGFTGGSNWFTELVKRLLGA